MNEPRPAPLRNSIVTGLKVLIAAGLVLWIARRGGIDFAALRSLAAPGTLCLLAAIVLAQLAAVNWRWTLLLRTQGFDLSVRDTMPLTFIGVFFNFAMPGGVGGDVAKGYYLLREHSSRKLVAASSLIMDRLLGLFALMATAALAAAMNWGAVGSRPELAGVACLAGVTAVILGAALGVALSPWVASWCAGQRAEAGGNRVVSRLLLSPTWAGVREALLSYQARPRLLLAGIAISFFNQLLMVAFIAFIGHRMGEAGLGWRAYFFLVPLGTAAQAIPVAPAGIGVGQAAMYFLFSAYLGRSSSLGATAITAGQMMTFALGLLGAWFYVNRRSPPA